MKGVVGIGDLRACGFFDHRVEWDGTVRLRYGGFFGIRKGRTARRVRRCLRRHGRAWEDPNEGLYGGPPQVG